MIYVVRYALLRARDIVNSIEPPTDRIDKMNEENDWFHKLEQSIKKDGIRNPINIWIDEEGKESVHYGGSRLMIAQKLDIAIPCVISDAANKFPHAQILKNVHQIRKCFLDPPKKIIYKENGINMSGCAEVHLQEELK